MAPRTARILRGLFAVYVVATAVHIAYVVAHEPYAFDAWNVSVDTGAKPWSVGRFFEFWYQQYTTSNPRIGQPLTYWAYKVPGVAELGSAVAVLALVLGGFVLALGRWPDRRNGYDLATLALGVGGFWFASPDIASYLFCRAYATNYVWAAAIQLWFVIALVRLHDPLRPRRPGAAQLVGIAILGVVAGMGNEHTGPTLVLFTLCYVAWFWRRHQQRSLFAMAGAAGALLGFALIFFAPGQSQRYDEFLRQRFTVTEQILVRGMSGNLEILKGLLFAAAPLLLLIMAMLAASALSERDSDRRPEIRERQRRTLTLVGLVLLAGILITATVFASPKLGPRFYMHAMLLLLAAGMGIARTHLLHARTFAPFAILAVVASGYAAARTVPLYSRLDRDSDARQAELAAEPLGGIYTATAFEQVGESWWFMGDDFRDQKKRELVAKYFALDRVVFRGADMWTTLGVTDVRLSMSYELEDPLCLDEIEALDLKPYIGRDITALHHAFLDAITEIKRAVPSRLRSIDLRATFLGERPPLPRERILVARWRDGVMEGYAGGVVRAGRVKDREVRLPAALQRVPWEIYLVPIGREPQLLGTSNSGKPLIYRPSHSGPHWVLACDRELCFVTVALTHRM